MYKFYILRDVSTYCLVSMIGFIGFESLLVSKKVLDYPMPSLKFCPKCLVMYKSLKTMLSLSNICR